MTEETRNDVNEERRRTNGIFAILGLAMLIFLFLVYLGVQNLQSDTTQVSEPDRTENSDLDAVGSSTENCTTDTEERQVFDDEIAGEYSLTVVEYVKGWDSHGKMVEKGTKVVGPALVKPDPNRAHVIGVLVGAEYVLKNDSVVWLLKANDEGVRSQYMFFSSKEEIAPKCSD